MKSANSKEAKDLKNTDGSVMNRTQRREYMRVSAGGVQKTLPPQVEQRTTFQNAPDRNFKPEFKKDARSDFKGDRNG